MKERQGTQGVKQASLKSTLKKHIPINVVIIIRGVNSDGTLIMSDHGKTTAYSEDMIFWVVSPHSGIQEITSITPKAGFPNLFQGNLARVGINGNVWMGTTIHVDSPINEEYAISYTKDDGTSKTYDPIIQLNP